MEQWVDFGDATQPQPSLSTRRRDEVELRKEPPTGSLTFRNVSWKWTRPAADTWMDASAQKSSPKVKSDDAGVNDVGG